MIKIGNHTIGVGQPVFVMAEAGVNHNGSFEIAKNLIIEAKKVGANCVKFQTFKAERVALDSAPKAKYQLGTTDPKETQIDMLRKLELSSDMYEALIALAKQENISLMSTPYNNEDVDFLDALGFEAFKLASIHLYEPTFLQYVARKNKPMIISTGMATLADVDNAVRAIRATGNEQFIVLQCTTNYPSRLEDANLRAMGTMREALDVTVGYSDHTQTHTACIVAVGLGATVIEKHFTLDKNLSGPDHTTSADPLEFAELVKYIREAETVLGSNRKEPVSIERENAVGMRRSIVTKRAIARDEILTEDMFIFKRPATGLSPALLTDILGKRATRDIAPDVMLQWIDIG